MTQSANEGFHQQANRLQELVEKAEALRDPAARAVVHECLQSLMALYGQGLARILELASGEAGGRTHPAGTGSAGILAGKSENATNAGTGAGAPGATPGDYFDRLINDPIVRGLLLIHGLHPLNLETRLLQAIDKVRPYLQSHGGNVELLSIEDDFARFRLQGACSSCPSSTVTLELALRAAIVEACPDLVGFDVEGVQSQPQPANGQKPQAPPGHDAHSAAVGWIVLEGVGGLRDGDIRALEAAGVPLILSREKGHLYAYRNLCPACALPLETSTTEPGELCCKLGHRYSVSHAGQGIDSPTAHLDPFPLLEEDSVVKVAVG